MEKHDFTLLWELTDLRPRTRLCTELFTAARWPTAGPQLAPGSLWQYMRFATKGQRVFLAPGLFIHCPRLFNQGTCCDDLYETATLTGSTPETRRWQVTGHHVHPGGLPGVHRCTCTQSSGAAALVHLGTRPSRPTWPLRMSFCDSAAAL